MCNRSKWTLRRKLLDVVFTGIVWSIPQQWCNYKLVTGKGVYVLPLPQSSQCLSEHSREEEMEPPPSVGEEVPGINFDNDL